MPLKQKDIYQKLKNINCKYLPKIYFLKDVGTKIQILEEYIQGETLEYVLKDFGILPLELVKFYMLGICNAIEILHSIGIIHKDISPKNIIIKDNAEIPVLIDFCISKDKNTSKDTTIMGTIGYASPEHYGFQSTDERSDIYSLGVLMNVMLTGKFPNEKLFNQTGFSKIIKKCIQISPDKRYKNVNQLYNDIVSIKLSRKDISHQMDNIVEIEDAKLDGIENKIFHGLYYEAIYILQDLARLDYNEHDRVMHIYLISKCYEKLNQFDLSAEVLIEYIYYVGEISSDHFIYTKLISLSDKISERNLKELSNIIENYLEL